MLIIKAVKNSNKEEQIDKVEEDVILLSNIMTNHNTIVPEQKKILNRNNININISPIKNPIKLVNVVKPENHINEKLANEISSLEKEINEIRQVYILIKIKRVSF